MPPRKKPHPQPTPNPPTYIPPQVPNHTTTIHHGAAPSPATSRAYIDFTTAARPFLNVDNAAVDPAIRERLLVLARDAGTMTVTLEMDEVPVLEPLAQEGGDAEAACARERECRDRAARAARRAAKKEAK